MIVWCLIILAVAAIAFSDFRWRAATARQVDSLAEHARNAVPRPRLATDLESLPAPVARYLAFALGGSPARIAGARIRWEGDMRLKPEAKWSPFTADQRFTADPPGFVWDASVHMLPIVPVRVRDSYVGGEGAMLGRLGGVITVVDQSGTREMAEGALARWLGEAAWFPAALLPGNGVTWEAVDDSTARATVTDGARNVSADFHFAPGGALTRMTATRWRDVDGKAVLTPFEGVYGRFERRQGVMVPATAEVAWLLPEGRFAYWRGRPVDVEYDDTMPNR